MPDNPNRSTVSAGSPSAHGPSAWSTFLVFLRLGCVSFGGPVAHLGYFQQQFVDRLRWLTDNEYAETVALCQFFLAPPVARLDSQSDSGAAAYPARSLPGSGSRFRLQS